MRLYKFYLILLFFELRALCQFDKIYRLNFLFQNQFREDRHFAIWFDNGAVSNKPLWSILALGRYFRYYFQEFWFFFAFEIPKLSNVPEIPTVWNWIPYAPMIAIPRAIIIIIITIIIIVIVIVVIIIIINIIIVRTENSISFSYFGHAWWF